MRTKEHEIDTEARKKVLLSFPKNWEHRELTGRDYGIDLFAEVFDSSLPKGNLIAIQLKGTEKDFSKNLFIDFPVNTLKYSELFQSPVFLMVCPICDINNRIYYLWLQEYINVILNYEKPDWRENKKTVRLFVPSDNIVQNNIEKIEFIAEQPQRLRDFCQLARICSDLEIILEDFLVRDDFIEEQYVDFSSFKQNRDEVDRLLLRIESYLTEILRLRTIIKLVPHIENDVLKKALLNIEKLKCATELDERLKYKRYVNRVTIVGPLMAILGLFNDASYSRALWEIEKTHIF